MAVRVYETNRRIDVVDWFKFLRADLVVALTATAVVDTCSLGARAALVASVGGHPQMAGPQVTVGFACLAFPLRAVMV